MREALLLSLLSFFVGIGQLIAQDRTLSGTVNDLLKGTNRGITSDSEGAFKRSVPASGTLVISSVGFETKEVAFSASTPPLNVTINTDVRDANFR